MIPNLTATLDFHSQALALRAERQRLIAGNIANADTPGYQARDFDFAAALRAASGSSSEVFPVKNGAQHARCDEEPQPSLIKRSDKEST